MPFILPPLSEQKIVVEKIDSLLIFLKHIEENYKDATSNIDFLDQSILAKAFRGELVPQDPNDEPASVLLERIRAEREQQGGGKQKRRSRRKQSG